MTISLCMIVKDEAENLPRCLNSVKDCVDEILVLDTGSQDDTIAIAQSYGAMVDTAEWGNDFATARNQSITDVTSDWILVLDADETLTAAGRELLQQLRSGEAIADCPVDNILAINLMRYEINADQSPYSEVSRLFRNRVGLQFERPYHETIDDSVMRLMQTEPHWQVILWPQPAIAHIGYGADVIAQRDKFARAAKIMAAYLAEHPDDAYICNKLGALFVSVGHTERGRILLERGLATQPTDAATLYELHYHLGLAYRDARLNAIAIDHYQKAVAQDVPAALKVGAWINLGSLYQAAQNSKSAIAVYEEAIAATPDFALPYFNLGIAKRAMGDLPGAIAAYEQAIEREPNYAAAYQNLGVALFKLGKVPESIEALQRAIALYRQSDPAQAERLLNKISALGIKV
ncbi:TPR domain-containing glycosyltransferase [Leptolyngbya iicbica]|uniref:Tetratricopeptide repeat protein n=2 Tax=Cyanophyceae TaxID=3028117 RepID=A0A4Q7EH59_9CYAN|nr:TPR domain-containing glycosyltransferase [Leptolyngbya sp. LK]RZM82695.1 tetratricopeptide repeat protein [Leptolyngbya sp. LK]